MKLLWFLTLIWALNGILNAYAGDEIEGAIYLVGSGLAYGLSAIIGEMRRP